MKQCLTILSFLFIWGCSNSKQLTSSNEKSISYLALGDSYTIGEAVEESGRWPNQLQSVLNSAGFAVSEPQIIAKTGWRTDELEAAINNAKLKGKYDLVSLLIGVNNQYQGKSIKVFEEELESLLNTAIKLAKQGKKGVFVLSIPDYSVSPFGKKKNPEKIEKEIILYNKICKAKANKLGVPFYNITDISRQANMNNSLLARDQLHPSARMYKAWVSSIYQSVIQEVLIPQGYTPEP